MKTALFLRRIGPYHHARFKAAAQQLDLHVVETRPGSQEYPWDFKPGEDYHQYQFPPSKNPEKGLTGKALDQHAKQTLDSIQPEVVVTVGWADQEYHAALLWASQQNIPCVVISDSGIDDVKRYTISEKIKSTIVTSFTAALVAGTKSKLYLETLGMSPDNIYTPWDVVDNDYFFKTTDSLRKQAQRPHNLPDKYFLCVSRFVNKKNISGLIRAFAGFTQKTNADYKLVLAGSGDLEGRIKEEIEKYDLSDKVVLTGFVQIDELPKYYAFAEAFILPSFTDQWGLVVNEAMASGLPVLVSENCGCTMDIVKDKVNGYTFDPYDVDGITAIMETFNELNDREKNDMGNASLDIIKGYGLEAFANGLYDACEKARESIQFVGENPKTTGVKKSQTSRYILKSLLLLAGLR